MNVSAQWSKEGINRLVKVTPLLPHDEHMDDDIQYPPGSGIQQWKLIATIPFRVEAVVLDYPTGRFIPLEGFKEVRLK